MAQREPKPAGEMLTGVNGSFTKEFEVFTEELAAQGCRLRMRRETLRLSQRQVSKGVGISLGLLSEIEAGISGGKEMLPFIDEYYRKEASSLAAACIEILTQPMVAKEQAA